MALDQYTIINLLLKPSKTESSIIKGYLGQFSAQALKKLKKFTLNKFLIFSKRIFLIFWEHGTLIFSQKKVFFIFQEMELLYFLQKFFLIFWGMKLSSPKIKKIIIFSEKKSFSYISEKRTFLKNFLYFRRLEK